MVKSRKKPRIKGWLKLSPKEKLNRIKSLEVLRLMHDGKSLSASSKKVGLRAGIVKSDLGSYLYKRKRIWHAKKIENNIQREMMIYEKGKPVAIIVRNSKDASLIGQYFNDVKRFLETGDKTLLTKYKKRVIRDAKGKKHKLETRPEKIIQIEERKEEPEFFDIYET